MRRLFSSRIHAGKPDRLRTSRQTSTPDIARPLGAEQSDPIDRGGEQKIRFAAAPVRSIKARSQSTWAVFVSALASNFDAGGGDVFDRIAHEIEHRGYAVMDAALPPDLVDALFVQICGLPDEALKPAGIGRVDLHQLNPFVRRDEIMWLEPEQPAASELLAWMEHLRLGINRHLFLGLFDYEAHYARYAPGAFYRRHRDAFAGGGANRVLSTVIYLNPNWSASDGGEMLLLADDDQQLLERVQPLYGRLVVFLSERFPHEVLPTRRTRYSIAGWFRVNGSIRAQIDPPR